MNILPDCMMPDGADPCAGYRHVTHDRDVLIVRCRQYGKIIADLLDHAVYDAERNDECIAAVDAARKALGRVG